MQQQEQRVQAVRACLHLDLHFTFFVLLLGDMVLRMERLCGCTPAAVTVLFVYMRQGHTCCIDNLGGVCVVVVVVVVVVVGCC